MARRKRYSAEIKRQALKRANDPGVIDVLVAEERGEGEAIVCAWVRHVTG